MNSTSLPLSDDRLAPLVTAYAEAQAAKTRSHLLGFGALLVCILFSAYVAEVDGRKFVSNISNFTTYLSRLFYLENTQPVWSDFSEWFWGFGKWFTKIIETLLIAYLGTIVGAVGAFVACFLAARNLVDSRMLVFVMRRLLEICRTVPELVFALTFVVAFGLGPLPGILALAIHTFGALGKQFAEVVENIDLKPFEGVSSTGATWTEAVRFAALPQVLPNFVSYGLMRFEINVRGAAIMGFVGAGGIGQDLLEAVRKFYYSDVSAMLVMIIATVMVIDYTTEKIRHRLLGHGGAR
ncbi:MAG: phosphonate ABC transporter, permease protein PhnE [Hyphomicrobiaceae bacterium]|nr:phosphonate ABC transporter, permease protein PhnE [Hyphomicrobiaceae bacterium]